MLSTFICLSLCFFVFLKDIVFAGYLILAWQGVLMHLEGVYHFSASILLRNPPWVLLFFLWRQSASPVSDGQQFHSDLTSSNLFSLGFVGMPEFVNWYISSAIIFSNIQTQAYIGHVVVLGPRCHNKTYISIEWVTWIFLVSLCI